MNNQQHETAQFLGLKLFLWNHNKRPSNEGLFIFNVSSEKSTHEVESKTTTTTTTTNRVCSVNFKHKSFVNRNRVHDQTIKLISETKLFDSRTNNLLGQQVSDYIRSFFNVCATKPTTPSTGDLVFVASFLGGQVSSTSDTNSSTSTRTGTNTKEIPIVSEDVNNVERFDDQGDPNIEESSMFLDVVEIDHVVVPNVEDLFQTVLTSPMFVAMHGVYLARNLAVSSDTYRMDVIDHGNVCFDDSLDSILSILRSRYDAKGGGTDDNVETGLQVRETSLVKIKPGIEVIHGGGRRKDGVRGGGEEELHGESCPICFDEMGSEKNVVVKMVSCNHMFHHGCVFKWLPNKRSCPYCRSSSLTDVYVEI